MKSPSLLTPAISRTTAALCFLICLAAIILTTSRGAAATIAKNNTVGAVQLDLTNAWIGGVVPGATDLAAFGSNNTASTGAMNPGAGVSFLGILATNNPGTSLTITTNSATPSAAVALGASGIDWSAATQVSGTNRTLTLNAPITLTSDQTWSTGTGLANTAQITATNVVSGSGRLTIGGAPGSSNQFVFLSGLNTFTGGLTLNAGGAVRGGSSTATVSGTNVTAGSFGTGNLTINGGTIFGNSGQLAFTSISVNADFSVNQGPASSVNARLTIGGGFDLGGLTRTVSVGGYTNIFTGANGILTSGQEKFRIMPISTIAPNTGPSNTIANGTLRLIRDAAGVNGSDYVSFSIGGGGVFFAEGAGLTIGNGVVTTFATATPFGGTNLPHLTVETGGYFNLSDAVNLRPASIRSLSGSGVVTTLATNTNGVSTLTISPLVGDTNGTFSGSINDGSVYTNLAGTTNLQGRVAILKNGAGTQILSGSNAMSGTITNNAGELRFARKVSLYAGNTSLWTNLAVNSGATLGLSLGGADGFSSSDLGVLVGNTNILKAGAKLALDVNSSNSPVVLSTVLSNSANPNGVAFTKTGAGRLILSGYTGTLSNALTVTGGTLQFSNLSTYSGSPSLSGGAVLDLGGATFPIPNTVTLTDGSMVNFTPGVSDPFAPTANVSYTGFSFQVNNLNDGTNGARTFTLANSILTVSGSVATNGLTISGASNGIMRFTGATTGQGDTNTSRGQITVQGAATLEFASNSVFDSYRPLSINSASNPTVLVSGGSISNLSYVIFGSASTNNTGTLRVTSGSLSVASPNPSGNGLYFGQNGGSGTLRLEGGSVSTPTIKVQSGTANIDITGGSLNIVTTNASGNPASATQLSQNGTVNFNMTGGSVIATNSKFNLSPANATSSFNVAYTQNGGLISSIEMSAGPGTFVMNGGTNVSAAGMYVGDNTNGVATFTQNGGLVQILGQSGSVAANDLVIGNASGNGTYVLNGGILEVFGKIRRNSGSGALVLNGGVLRYTNTTGQAAFIGSSVVTTAGINGAIFDITAGGATNAVPTAIGDAPGEAGRLIKLGAGALAIARTNLAYSGNTEVAAGSLLVTGSTVNQVPYTAEIGSSTLHVTFEQMPASGDSATILPGSLIGSRTVSGSGPQGEPVALQFTAANSQFIVQGGSPYDSWLTNYPTLQGSDALPASDPDGDGYANSMEFSFGGNPTVGTPALLVVSNSGANAVISFIADTNSVTYGVQKTTNLVTGPWAAFTPTNLVVSPNQTGVLLSNYTRLQFTEPATGRGFFRVQGTANTAP
jgi:fibronectin-binding autotransporter adhesin